MRPDQVLIDDLKRIGESQKRAIQIRVGDQTEMFGKVTDVNVHTTGDAVEIIGDKDRATVWKNALIKVKEK